MLHDHDHDLTLDHIVEIRKQSAPEEAEPKERTMTVSKLTEWLGLTVAGIKVFEDTDWKEQRAATARQGIVSLLVMRRS